MSVSRSTIQRRAAVDAGDSTRSSGASAPTALRVSNPLLSLGNHRARARAVPAGARVSRTRVRRTRARARARAPRHGVRCSSPSQRPQRQSRVTNLALDAYPAAPWTCFRPPPDRYHNLTLLTLVGASRKLRGPGRCRPCGRVPDPRRRGPRKDDRFQSGDRLGPAPSSRLPRFVFRTQPVARSRLSVGDAANDRAAARLAALVLLQRKGRVLDALSSQGNGRADGRRMNEGRPACCS